MFFLKKIYKYYNKLLFQKNVKIFIIYNSKKLYKNIYY